MTEMIIFDINEIAMMVFWNVCNAFSTKKASFQNVEKAFSYFLIFVIFLL